MSIENPTSNELALAVAERAEAGRNAVQRSAPKADTPKQAITHAVQRATIEIAKALPEGYDGGADRFARSVLSAVFTDPKGNLIKCDPRSIVGAALHAAQLGLEIGPLGEAYLVPRGGQCTFMASWKGLKKLAWQAGVDILAKTVRQGDQFDYWYDLDGPHLHHRPTLGNSGQILGYWGLGRPVGGGIAELVVEDPEWIERRRKAGSGDSPAWKAWPEEMAHKTIIRAVANKVPKTSRHERFAVALASDGLVRSTHEELTAPTEALGELVDVSGAYDDDVVDGEVID